MDSEARLIHAASAALARAATRDDLDAAWREIVAPEMEELAPETQELLKKLRDLRLSTIAWSAS